jgi:hypothetical protein
VIRRVAVTAATAQPGDRVPGTGAVVARVETLITGRLLWHYTDHTTSAPKGMIDDDAPIYVERGDDLPDPATAIRRLRIIASGHDRGRGECVCELCSTLRDSGYLE